MSSGSPTKRGRMEDDNDAIAQRLAAMERDVLKREAAAEQKRLALLKEVEQEEKEARMARIQFEHARRESLGDNHVRSSPPPTGPCVRLVATQMTTHIDPASKNPKKIILIGGAGIRKNTSYLDNCSTIFSAERKVLAMAHAGGRST